MGQVFNFIFFLIILLYNADNEAKIEEIKCTQNCFCDMFENYRRATCENRTIINLKDNVPRETEILEYSFNYVSELEENEFMKYGLTNMKLLNLSHNKIRDINLHAFAHMNQIQTLDLSYNALQYVLFEWFWDTTKLRELYLNNNNLGKLKDGPLIESNTLQILNLAHCQIPALPALVFSKLPNLKILDIRMNNMININPGVLKYSSFQEIKIDKNEIQCRDASNFIMYCKKKNIINDYQNCKKSESIKMEDKFQRIVLPRNERNSWIFEKVEEQEKNITSIVKKIAYEENVVLFILSGAPVTFLILTLCVGFLLGLIIGCSFNLSKRKPKKKPKNQRFKRCYSIIRYTKQDEQYLLANDIVNHESTPMPDRRGNLESLLEYST